MPTTLEFDTLNHDAWTGEMTVTVLDNDNTPNRVLDIIQDWNIKVRWSITSEDPALVPITQITAGHWRLEAFVESIGTASSGYEGPVGSLPLFYEDILWGSNGNASYKPWEHTIHVPAGQINEPGIYKVTVMLQYHMADNTFTPMVGFAEYPLICFNRLP